MISLKWGVMAAVLYALKWFHIGLFIGLVATMMGCWDTATGLAPGERMHVEPITIGEDYRIEGCQVTRLVSDALRVNANALTLFAAWDADRQAAKRNYLNRTVHVTGTVSDITNMRGWTPDRIELTLTDTYSVRCEFREDLDAAALHPLYGTTVTLAGRMDGILFNQLRLFDCTLLEVTDAE